MPPDLPLPVHPMHYALSPNYAVKLPQQPWR